MSTFRILGAAAVIALFALPAAAADRPSPKDPMTYPEKAQAPSAADAGMNSSAVVLLSSPTPESEAARLRAGDPTVISNQPVADTPRNRARYGQPMSNAGRRTAPIGD
jgi:hypothetical protein